VGFDSRLQLQRLLEVTTHATRGASKGGLLLLRQVVRARSIYRRHHLAQSLATFRIYEVRQRVGKALSRQWKEFTGARAGCNPQMAHAEVAEYRQTCLKDRGESLLGWT
jgi:hypothetical protein